MRQFFPVAAIVAVLVIAVGGCGTPGAAKKPKRDPRFVDQKAYLGIYIGTPTEAAKAIGKKEAYLEIKPQAIYVLKYEGVSIMGTYAYLGGELELNLREIDGISVVDINRTLKAGPDAIEKNRLAGREPDTKLEMDRYVYEWKGVFWRLTVQPDGYTHKDTPQGPGMYVFKRAPAGTKMPAAIGKEVGETQYGGVAGMSQ